jgi:hypothetical protein
LHDSAYSVSEMLNTNTTAQVIITYDGTPVRLINDGDEFIVSTPTFFSDVSLTYNKTTSDTNITLTNFSDDIRKNYTYTMSEVGNSNYIYDSTTRLSGTNINNVYIDTDNILYWNRPHPSATASISFDVKATAIVTGITETSFFTVVMEFINQAPKVNAITQSVHWKSTNNTFDFSGNDADIGDSLSYSISSSNGGPFSDGPLNLTDGTVEIVNTNQFKVGSSNNAALIFFYRANDGSSYSTPAQITINKSNDAPTANAVTDTMHWNSSKRFNFSGNDTNSDSLTYVISNSSSGPFSGDPLNLTDGTVEIVNTNQFSVDSSNNTTLTFFYQAFDGAAYSPIKTITIEKSNTAPTASNIVRFTHTDPVNITLIGSDNNDPFSFSLGTTTQNYGTWSGITASNKITYTPSGNQLGVDTAYYSISDIVDVNSYTITVYSGLTNIKDGGQDLTELYERKHDTTSGYIALTNHKSNYQVNGTDLVNHFERENGTGTSTSNLKVTVGATTYPLDRIFKKR